MTTARTDTYAQTRHVGYFLGLGRTERLQCAVRHGSDGSLVEPVSGTITVEMPDGSELVSAAAVSVVGSVASYDLTTLSTHAEGGGWTVIWLLTMADGNVYPFRYEAWACEHPPYCPISTADLWGGDGIAELRHRIPQQWRAVADGGDGSGWQPVVDAVYYALLEALISDGHRPWRIRSIHSSRPWCLSRALLLCCRHLAAGLPAGSDWQRREVSASIDHNRVSGSLRFQYDDEDQAVRRSARPTLKLAPAGRPWL